MASVMYVLIAKVSYEAIQAAWTMSPIVWNFVIFLCWQSWEHGTYVILYLHRALNKVTQSANQHMHTFNFFYLLNLI